MSCKGGTLLEVVNSIWLFFQDQILGMKWLNGLIGNGLSLLGLDINSRLGGSIQFFIRCNQNHNLVMFTDFLYIVYSKLFSTRTKQKNFRAISWYRCKYHIRIVRNSYTILLMFFYPVVYRFYKCRITVRSNFFLFDFFAYG